MSVNCLVGHSKGDEPIFILGFSSGNCIPYCCIPVETNFDHLLVSIVVSIPACHAGDRGSIPRRGAFVFFFFPITYIIHIGVRTDAHRSHWGGALMHLNGQLFTLTSAVGNTQNCLASREASLLMQYIATEKE